MSKVNPPKPGHIRIFRNGFFHWKSKRWISTGRPIPMDIPIGKVK